MIPLNQIQVPKPCGEDWEAMDGDARRRFCAGCGCHVHDLSALTTQAAQDLLDRADGRVCVRFETRPDGTVRTQDAPTQEMPGRFFWPRRLAAAASWAVALVVAGLGLTARAETVAHQADQTTPKAHAAAPVSRRPRVTVGKIAIPRQGLTRTLGIVATPLTPPRPPARTMGVPLPPPTLGRPAHVMGDVGPVTPKSK